MEFIGLIIGLVLTLCIYSYIFGDNWFYRLGTHILVGVSAGYAVLVAVRDVLLPTLANPPSEPISLVAWILPLLLGVLLLFSRFTPRLMGIGNLALAVLVGVGAAVALTGAILGTLLPQATAAAPNALFGLVTAVLTACTLLYFHFVIRSQPDTRDQVAGWQRLLGGGIGRAVIMITFGVLFAGVISTSLTLLTAQLSSLLGAVIR